MKVYLCGPINGCTDEECKDWRELIKNSIGSDNCVDPMNRDYRGVEDVKYKEIVELDKLDVISCDVVLVNYVKPSVGTSMEILFAWSNHKRIILICRKEEKLSPWLIYHCTEIVHSLQDAINLISG